MLASLESRMESLATRIETHDKEVHQEPTIYKSVVSTQVTTTHKAPKVEMPKPHVFNGKKDAKDINNFLWHMHGVVF